MLFNKYEVWMFTVYKESRNSQMCTNLYKKEKRKATEVLFRSTGSNEWINSGIKEPSEPATCATFLALLCKVPSKSATPFRMTCHLKFLLLQFKFLGLTQKIKSVSVNFEIGVLRKNRINGPHYLNKQKVGKYVIEKRKALSTI